MPNLRICIFGIFVILGLSCKKENKNIVGSCSGTVYDQFNNPISNATIIINSRIATTYHTDASGNFSVFNIPTGQVTIAASSPNYISDTKTIMIGENINTIVNFTLQIGTNTLTISPDSINLSAETQLSNFNIISNAAWVIGNVPSWLDLSTTNGHGNQPMSLRVTENQVDTTRMVRLRVTAGTLTRVLVVVQAPPVKIISSPNGTSLISDSVSIVFNQPITVKSITPLYTNCIGDNGFRYFNNNRGVKFHYGCGLVGNTYEFNIEVTNNNGKTSTVNFNAQYFTQRFDLTKNGWGNLKMVQLQDSGVWVRQQLPTDLSNKLDYFHLTDLKLIKELTFSFEFTSVGINPIDNLFYIPSSDKIYVVNPENGAIVRTITLQQLPGDNPSDPQIRPGGYIKFFANGKAIFNAIGNGAYNHNLKVLDPQNGDKTTNLATDYDLDSQTEYFLNNDGTIIYTHDYDAGSNIYMIDSQTLNVKQLLPPYNSRIDWLGPNQFTNDLQIFYYFGTYIWNPLTGATSAVYGATGSSDFTNRKGHPQEVYQFADDGKFNILDFSTATTLSTLNTIQSNYAQMGDPFVTKDGKYMIVIGNYDVRYLFLFDTRCFRGTNLALSNVRSTKVLNKWK